MGYFFITGLGRSLVNLGLIVVGVPWDEVGGGGDGVLGEGGGGIECDWDASDSFPGWRAGGGEGVGGVLVRESCDDGEGGGGGAGELEAGEGEHGVVVGGSGAAFSLGLLVGIMCANIFGISSNLLLLLILSISSSWSWYSFTTL